MLACPMLCIDLVPEPAVFIPRYQHFVRRQPQTDSWLAGQFGAPNRNNILKKQEEEKEGA
jgi:hypothetical protein